MSRLLLPFADQHVEIPSLTAGNIALTVGLKQVSDCMCSTAERVNVVCKYFRYSRIDSDSHRPSECLLYEYNGLFIKRVECHVFTRKKNRLQKPTDRMDYSQIKFNSK
jgi:hypothetical protein